MCNLPLGLVENAVNYFQNSVWHVYAEHCVHCFDDQSCVLLLTGWQESDDDIGMTCHLPTERSAVAQISTKCIKNRDFRHNCSDSLAHEASF